MIELPEEATTTRITTADSSTTSSASQTPVDDPIFDDEETRSFYEDLPDLRAKLPEVLFSNEKEREPESDANKQGGATAAASSTTDGGASTVASTSAPNLATTTTSSAPEASSSSSSSSAEEKRDKIPSKLDLLLQRLPSCVNRDMIDQIATDFCYINSRANRKRLIKALFQVPRTELVLVRRERAAARAYDMDVELTARHRVQLPYYSRLVAVLAPCMPDVGTSLVSMLEDEFNALIRQKDQTNIETKVE